MPTHNVCQSSAAMCGQISGRSEARASIAIGEDKGKIAAASPSTTHLPEARPEGKAAPEAPQQPAEGAKVVALETFRKK